MGTTASHGLPYPENTDRVTNGASAIQALAESTDTALDAAGAGKVAAGNGGNLIFHGRHSQVCGVSGDISIPVPSGFADDDQTTIVVTFGSDALWPGGYASVHGTLPSNNAGTHQVEVYDAGGVAINAQLVSVHYMILGPAA